MATLVREQHATSRSHTAWVRHLVRSEPSTKARRHPGEYRGPSDYQRRLRLAAAWRARPRNALIVKPTHVFRWKPPIDVGSSDVNVSSLSHDGRRPRASGFDSGETLSNFVHAGWLANARTSKVEAMSAPRQTWTPKAPPPHWSVPESVEHQEERNARVAEMMAQARKHSAKATLRHPEAQRIAHLHHMYENLRHEYAAGNPPEQGDLADAIVDLELMIARAILR